MPSVVIIHAAEDALPARALGEKLRQIKLTPMIEAAPGAARQTAIGDAALAIVLWSPRSLNDEGVNDDAGFASSIGKLVHAGMQSVHPPPEFKGEPRVDLTGWRGEEDFHPWLQLAALLAEKAGVAPPPPPTPRPPSGFFQPGRVASAAPPRAAEPPPQQQAPHAEPAPVRAPPPPRSEAYRPLETERPPEQIREKSGPNMALIGILTFVFVALAGGAGYYFWNQSQGGPGEWAAVDQEDPAALRAFIAQAQGTARSEAQSALRALETQRYEQARSADSIEALEAFVADFPSGANTLAARGRIAELRAQPETPDENALPEEIIGPAEPVDPDLLPPGAFSGPEPVLEEPPSSSGPVPLQPAPQPAPEPEPEPGPGPTPLTPGGDPLD